VRAKRGHGVALSGATQRDRLVVAMGELAAEVGVTAIGVHHVCQRAGMSRRTFYELYADRQACFLDTLAEADGRLSAHVEAAAEEAGPDWEDRAVAVTGAVIAALDADRVLARLCVVAARSAGRDAVRLRRTALDRIAGLLADAPEAGVAGDVLVSGALGGVWELVHRRLTDEPARPLGDLTGVAVYLLLAPFAGRRRAAERATAVGGGVGTACATRWSPTIALDRPLVATELTRQTLSFLAEHAGAANIDVARALDVRHESQISRHLARLQREGMVSCQKRSRANAWRLTPEGRQTLNTLMSGRARDGSPPRT
jgi:AcrR family transcriptional regulator